MFLGINLHVFVTRCLSSLRINISVIMIIFLGCNFILGTLKMGNKSTRLSVANLPLYQLRWYQTTACPSPPPLQHHNFNRLKLISWLDVQPLSAFGRSTYWSKTIWQLVTHCDSHVPQSPQASWSAGGRCEWLCDNGEKKRFFSLAVFRAVHCNKTKNH